MAGNKDFIEIIREIRGSAAPGQPITDGIWYELTTADTNGNPGIYGDILAKYGIIVGDGGAIEQIAASVQAALESEEASAQSANEAEAARDTILNMQVATGAPESAVTWDGTTLTVPKGYKGETGVSVESIVRTNGDGSAGTFDTYTITLTDASTSTFTVYNGVNGTNGVDGEIGPTGNGIVNITRTNGTGQAGTIDTYTITLSDASTSTFDVYNGVDGNDGANGLDGNGIATILRTNGNGAAGTIDTYTITYNDTTTTTFNVYNGANGINGLDGIDGTNGLDGRGIVGIARTSGTGQPGETDEYTITYTDTSTSVFNVYNGINGTNGLDGTDGTDGVDGRGVVSLLRTSGTGLPGTTDIYTMTYTDATTSTLTVYNGNDGTCSGDMSKSVYDTTNNGKVDTAEVAESVPWTGVTDKPNTFPPDTHNHDTLYEPVNTNIQTHITSTSNPHSVTKAQVGLSNVDNTADNVKNVATATKWATARTITLNGDVAGSVSVDGSANVTITTTVQPNSIELGTDTTGNYMVNVTAGSGISVSHTQGEGSTATITNSAPNVTTNITTAHSATNVIVNSSDGTDGTINSATQTLAGVMSAADKTKLDGIDAGAQVNVATDLSLGTITTTTIPINSSTGADVSLPAATTSLAGLLSATDKTKLDGIATSANNYVHPTADGSLHVPATGTTNNGKVLTAGATAGSLSWQTSPEGVTDHALLSNIGTRTHAQLESDIALKANVASPVFTGNVTGLGIATGTSFNSITALASAVPVVAGTAAVGTSTTVARQDHVHPAQTTITGNAGTATKADKLTVARSITISGDIDGVASFDGSENINISTTVKDYSHAHVMGDVDGLGTALSLKSDTTHTHTAAQVGLGNVDNTADLNKPVSTATQAILDLKANKSTTYTKTEVDNIIGNIQAALDLINGVSV